MKFLGKLAVGLVVGFVGVLLGGYIVADVFNMYIAGYAELPEMAFEVGVGLSFVVELTTISHQRSSGDSSDFGEALGHAAGVTVAELITWGIACGIHAAVF